MKTLSNFLKWIEEDLLSENDPSKQEQSLLIFLLNQEIMETSVWNNVLDSSIWNQKKQDIKHFLSIAMEVDPRLAVVLFRFDAFKKDIPELLSLVQKNPKAFLHIPETIQLVCEGIPDKVLMIIILVVFILGMSYSYPCFSLYSFYC